MENDGSCSSNSGCKDEPQGGRGLDLNSIFFLENREVAVTYNSDGLSWKVLDASSNDESFCFGIKLIPKVEKEIKLSEIYAVEFKDCQINGESNLQNDQGGLLCNESGIRMYNLIVHGFQREKSQPPRWVLVSYTFSHKDSQTCHMWANRINASLELDVGRPKNILVFVHPKSGKGKGWRVWETVAPIFRRSNIKLKVIVTEKAGHAFDLMASTADEELKSYDGVIAVGGDGFFNEILNGFLVSRHKTSYPPNPSDTAFSSGTTCSSNKKSETEIKIEDQSPLLSCSTQDCGEDVSSYTTEGGSCSKDGDSEFSFADKWFRFGIIPAGSTDAIVMCTTGSRDPTTSALKIVLGEKICVDIAQVVRWKTTATSRVEPYVRYAASFAGYGFYGDVIAESEKYRWMGPRRYDYAGTTVFLRHSTYEAEVAFLEAKSEVTSSHKSERIPCRVNCAVCKTKQIHKLSGQSGDDKKWVKSRGQFLSIGAAVISCRNERAPDGLVADAHLSDGFLHLIMIKDCPHAFYLWHLTQLAMKGGNPMNFKFVEHHKTTAFTFTSFGNQSVWNLDGELFHAHQLSAQVFRGLVDLFASGPEV